MTGILSSTFGTFRPAAPITVTEKVKVQIKTAGTSISSGSFSFTSGNTILVLLAWDPSGNAIPIVQSVSETSGFLSYNGSLTAQFTAPTTTSSGTGVIIQPLTFTATNSSATNITVGFSASVTAKTMIILELTNATTTQRSTSTTARGTTTAVSYTGPATVAATDIVITLLGVESPTAIASGSTSTTGGTWSALSQIQTTGGTANTNIGIGYQYKIITAAGAQAIAWTTGATPNNWGSRTIVLQHA